MDQYRTDEQQVEALRRWWDENGRSTIVAIVITLGAGFGWQSWKASEQQQRENASDLYQAMLQAVGSGESSEERRLAGVDLAETIKSDYSGSTYAQFAALHLAAMAVNNNDLAEAQAQLRWVLGKADKGSDAAYVAQLRLARVLASSGDAEQALAILTGTGAGSYQAPYAVARGDILLAMGRNEEAREAYTTALTMAAGSAGRVNMPAVQQKLQSLMPVPGRALDASVEGLPEVVDAADGIAADAEAARTEPAVDRED